MNNYVLYSGQLWEVVETNDTNHTIKLVSPVSLTSIAYGESNNWNASWVRKWLNEYFYSKLERTDLIKETEFCIDPVDATPDSYTKMTTCTNKVEEKVGLLTYEDYIYALDAETIQDGGSYLDEAELSYLITPTTLGTNQIWHTSFENPGYITTTIHLTKANGQGVRPVISIRDNVLVKDGKGTRNNPYILSSERSLKENTKLNLGKVGDYIYLDESNNPYVTKIDETYVKGISKKTSTSKVRYRIVNINSDGSIKVERADVLRNLPIGDISVNDKKALLFYSIDTGDGLTSCLCSSTKKYGEEGMNSKNCYTGGCSGHKIFNPNEGSGDYKPNTGQNIGYYLNNAPNGFYNWYSSKSKKMILLTPYNIYESSGFKDYSTLSIKASVDAKVILPNVGEMYSGNDIKTSYWHTNVNEATDSVDITEGSNITYSSSLLYWWISARPVVTLSQNVYVISGDGTVMNPYVLDI